MFSLEFLIPVVLFLLFGRFILPILNALIEHFLLLLLTGIPILLVGLFYLISDSQPTVVYRAPPSPQALASIRNKLAKPRRRPGASDRSVRLSNRDLNSLSNVLLNRYRPGATAIELLDNKLVYKASITLPDNPINPYLNLYFELSQHQQRILINNLSIGKLRVPDEIARGLVEFLLHQSQLDPYQLLGLDKATRLTIADDYLSLSYGQMQAVESASQTTQMAPENPVDFYRNKLDNIVSNHDKNWLLSLADLLQPLFKEALHRSQQADPIAENRAIIQVVNQYVNYRHNIQALIPDTSPTPRLYLPVYIYKRNDLAQHFMASAALTIFGNAELSHFVGQEKEIYDADQGSGFSFSDLTADRAGIRFAKTATESHASALRLQKNMASIKDYQAFMPNVKHLPDNMSLTEFTERFGSFNSPRFLKQLEEIDRRINACLIYKN